ncbi:MAG: CRISPR system precrRNA processing endoribonuclease RAMP protein Cas6 [Armatimonadetes bacterium]|nr:CRISPR system precrRNA processing endoribonuclease RAMP protein Cas6 [Armatimonadota bacterium]
MLRFTRLKFEVRVTDEGKLPRFFGPTLRGALGLTFRKMVCVTHLDDCSPCLLRFQCPYTRFFEPFAPSDHPFFRRIRQMPRPFVLQVTPPSDKPYLLRVGETLSFRIVLWHQIETFLPYTVIAVQKTFERGIGQGLKARLERVTAEVGEDEKVVFEAEEGLVSAKVPSIPIEDVMVTPTRQINRLTVHFLTPTRIDLSGKLQNPITFSSLIKAANERGRALFWAYEQKEPNWNGRGLILAAERVEMVRWEQRWMDLQRFSRRQGEKLKVGGVIGWAEFSDEDLSPFLPLLRLMEWVHVGKLGTMGLGQIIVTA